MTATKVAIKVHDYAYFRDGFCKFEDANISVMNHSFMYGSAVFEGIRAYYNKERNKLYVLHAKEHFARLLNSCKIMMMQADLSVDEMTELLIELLKKNNPNGDVYIRPSWFKDSVRIGPSLYCKDQDNEDSFIMTSIDLGDYLATDKGISVHVSAWRRLSDNAIPARSKVNGSYVNTGLAKAHAVKAGFDDAIFLNEDGHVAEGSAMNLFIIRNGKLITSNLTDNILEGITRKLVIELAQKELNLEVEQRTIDRTELYVADEAFFCGTGAQIVPIGFIDNYEISSGKPGAITRKLQDIYANVCRGNNDSYKDVLIEIDL